MMRKTWKKHLDIKWINDIIKRWIRFDVVYLHKPKSDATSRLGQKKNKILFIFLPQFFRDYVIEAARWEFNANNKPTRRCTSLENYSIKFFSWLLVHFFFFLFDNFICIEMTKCQER